MEIETWKSVPGWDGFYDVSDMGNVRSLSRMTKSRMAYGQVLRQTFQNSGYKFIGMSNGKIHKNGLVHRLVAMAFLPNPNNLGFVNHKDGVKTNNKLSNLEWCTKSENQIHAYATGLKKITKRHLERLVTWNKTDHGIKTDQFTKCGKKIRSFTSMAEAAELTGLNYNAIVDCVRGRHKTCGGFVFKTS